MERQPRKETVGEVERKGKINFQYMEEEKKFQKPDADAPLWFIVVMDWRTGLILATGEGMKATRAEAEANSEKVVTMAQERWPGENDLFIVSTYSVEDAKRRYRWRVKLEALSSMADQAQDTIDRLEAKDEEEFSKFDREIIDYYKDQLFDLNIELDALGDYDNYIEEDADAPRCVKKTRDQQ